MIRPVTTRVNNRSVTSNDIRIVMVHLNLQTKVVKSVSTQHALTIAVEGFVPLIWQTNLKTL